MSHNVKVLIRDCEDDPILIWDTLKTSFIQQWTMPCFNAYHALLSVETSDSEALDSLINRVDEQIRVIKSLSPSSFTLDDLYCYDPPPFFSSPSTVTITPAAPAQAPAPVPAAAPAHTPTSYVYPSLPKALILVCTILPSHTTASPALQL